MNFYPRPPRGGRLQRSFFTPAGKTISIHALREEGDRKTTMKKLAELFLSTPSARRATAASAAFARFAIYFYPRPPRGGRQRPAVFHTDSELISIHALREEGDVVCGQAVRFDNLFLSTPSARRATSCIRCLRKSTFYFYPRPPRGGRRTYGKVPRRRDRISIHALREEGDASPNHFVLALINFYPRPPRGGRPFKNCVQVTACLFLSTPSARRATGPGGGMEDST